MCGVHEWALAEAVIDAVIDVAAKKNASKITEIEIVIGELQTIDIENFKYALDVLREGTMAEGAKVRFITEKPRLRCNICGYEWTIGSISSLLGEREAEAVHFIPELIQVFVSCPKCGGGDIEIVAGRGVYVRSIRVE